MTANACRYKISLWADESTLELGSGDGCALYKYTKELLNCTPSKGKFYGM